ncbi:hypothetical protein NA63_2948 [Flavobacteriaceae bacterium MAR_2010_105]|nr:hypothetical protein NA63_2948 [Flavobacteriaceae bacterium MAR_2010_105]
MLEKTRKMRSKPFQHHMVKTMHINNIQNYKRFINWVSGDFDLYLKLESKELNVHFPGGKFKIKKLETVNDSVHFEIEVSGSSKNSGQRMMDRITNIFNHVVSLNGE